MRCLVITSVMLLVSASSVFANTSFTTLETTSSGRLGIAAIDTSNHVAIQYHARERFPMTSTFKFILVAAILKRSMTDAHFLQKNVMYTKADIALAGYGPITAQHLKTGMTIAQLCQAAITHSDNAAANLLMQHLGGPQAVTVFARSIGDPSFRLDRWEPQLNSAIAGDVRDTTTPLAMATDLQRLVLSHTILGVAQRAQLKIWLQNNTTGATKIRAAVPHDWLVGDKTGHGDHGTTNDIDIIWPPHCAPIVVAIYVTQINKLAQDQDAIIVQATHHVLQQLAQMNHCIKK